MSAHSLTLPLYRLIYVSRVAPQLRVNFENQVEEIVNKSELNNRRADVKGVLITHDGWFIQALEGEMEVITELYARISADPRHEAVRRVSCDRVDTRLFGSWGMRVGHPPAEEAKIAFNGHALSASVLLSLLRDSLTIDADHHRSPSLNGAEIVQALPEQQFEDVVRVAHTKSH